MKYPLEKCTYQNLTRACVFIPIICTILFLSLLTTVQAAGEMDNASALKRTASHMGMARLQPRDPITDEVILASQPPTTTAVGDLIWFDADNDGSFDADEQGINNVIVALYPTGAPISATPLMTTTSTALDGRDGRYLFSAVQPGEYFIHVPATQFQPDGPLAGFVSTGPTELDPNDDENEDDPGDDNGLNNAQPEQNGISSGPIQLVLGDEPVGEKGGDIPIAWDNYDNLTIDFGFYQPLHIGDMIWRDSNANGIYEPLAGETGVSDIGVELYTPAQSTPLAATQTDADGHYHFDTLEPGQYYLRFITATLPADHRITPRGQGDDSAIDSDADPLTGWARNEDFLLSGQDHADLDMGIFPLVGVGGRVWYDLNVNGLRDADEENAGIADIAVRLFYAATNQPVPNPTRPTVPFTAVTDAGGRYLFDKLIPGDYYVLFDPATFPANHLISPPHAGGALLDVLNDSDADPASGRTDTTGFLDGSETSLTLDMGLYSPVAVGGRVWLDANRNGRQEPLGADSIRDTDDDEPRVSAVTVRIYKEGAPFAAVAETQTDADGSYMFGQLPANSYVVEFDSTTLPLGHQITLRDAGANDVDSDADPSSGQTAPTGPLTPGQRQLHTDLGIWEPVSVAGQVWYDLNNDGIQSARELLGAANVAVALYAAEQPISANCDARRPATSTNQSETAPCVAVEAATFAQSPLYTAATNSRGQYAFNDLPPGNYIIHFDPATLPAGYQFTARDTAGISGYYDSDVDPASGQSGATGFLFSGQNRRSIDAGIWLPTAVSGRVWFDQNWNGLQDAGEGSVPNVAVTVFAEGGAEPIATQRTDAAGAYRFANLPPASYYLYFDPATLPTGYNITMPNVTAGAPADANPDAIDSDVNPSSGYSASTGQLRSGYQYAQLDMGLRTLNGVRIGDVVWHDHNANGLRESAEPGLANVRVELYSAAAPTALITATQTDAGGNYLFEQIAPGDYVVRFDPASFPSGYGLSEPQPGGSQADPQSGRTPATGVLAANAQKLDLDAALYKPAALGGVAWIDANGNGLHESGELALRGVTVELFYGDGRAAGQSAVTDADGNYLFSELLPGAYYVQFALPAGYRFSPTDAQIVTRLEDESALLADDVDSDASPVADHSGQTAPVTISSGQHYASLDVGAYIPLQIGDRIWFDANNNGRVDEAESGLADVLVQLTDLQNRLIATATTAVDGAYLFENLPTGSYAVLLPPANFAAGGPLFGHLSSTGYAGDLQASAADAAMPVADLGIDSLNPAETGIRSITLRLQAVIDSPEPESTNTDHRTAAPLGFYKPLNIGNRLWLDRNNNGRIDEAEPGLDDVQIHLYRDEDSDGQPDGASVRQQKSANDGYYLFDNLGAGQYVIQVPDSNFQTDGALAGMASSAPGLDQWVETMPPTQTVWIDAVDGQDDGRNTYTPWLSGVRSGTIKLMAEEQPLGETDQLSTTQSIVSDANSNLTVDFGFYKPLSLSSRIWLDIDNNGQFDAQEGGIENVALLLYADADQDGAPEGDPLAQTVTGPNGDYRFWGLLPGGYVAEVATANFAEGGALSHFQLSGGDVITPAGGLVRTMPVWLTDDSPTMQDANANPMGQSVQEINSLNMIELGFYEPVAVSGRIWLDGNGNGIQDVDEIAGPANIQVTLYSVNAQTGSRTAINFTRTDTEGRYHFAQLLPGEYAVSFDLEALAQAGYAVTQPNAAGIDGLLNSDVAPDSGATATTDFLFSGAAATGLDLGVYVPASLGDLVWLDANINGIYEPDRGEKGVAGVRVLLFAADSDAPLADPNDPGAPWSSTTDVNGRYQFSGLTPGAYFVQFDLNTLPAAHLVAPPDRGHDDAVDSDANPNTGLTSPVAINDGALNSSLDMGVYSPISVGDWVWFDDNANGIQDPGEEGVPGVRATLYTTSTNAPVPDFNNPGLPLRTVTDADGRYLFANLPADGYFVQFDLTSLPAGYRPSPQHAAGSNSIDSDADTVSGQTAPTGLLAAGDAHLSLDMGIWAPASLGDRVWFDLNANGLQDAGEPGAANVLVQLLDAQFAPTGQSVRTDANGRYLFDNLPLDHYAVQFDLASLPAGHLPTLANMGSDSTRNSDADPQSGRTALTPVLTSGQLAWGLDMGVVGVVTIGDSIWLDANRNGIQDAGESGVAAIGVMLFKANGEPATDIFGAAVPPTTTDDNGAYRFENLSPGAYFVQFNLADLPPNHVVSAVNMGANDALDSDASPSTGHSGVTNFLPGGFQDLTLDMGVHLPIGVRVGDFVWEDLDADGVQDWGEPGVAGVAVDLYVIDAQGQGVFTGQRVSTDAAGAYMFNELPPGQYYVVFDLATLPAGYKITAPDVGQNVGATGDGVDVSNDSDADPVTGQTHTTAAIPSNGQELALDMGIYKSAELGGRIWLDSDADGAQDVAEFGLRDLQVTLLDANGAPTAITLRTGLDGRYLITDLAPGDYYVQFELPAEYTFSTPNQGRSRINDSDVDPLTGRTPRIHLQSGQSDQSWSAGLHKGAAVGNYVWYDGDGDGLQGEDELSIFGVTVQLYSSAGELIGTTLSDGSGLYGFSELEPGEYYVVVAPPTGFVLTHALRGNDEARDSNIDPKTKRSNVFSVQAGKGNPTIDAGLTLAASIGNFVWYDRNGNGYKDVSEDGVGGIEVILYDENGEAPRVVSSVLTDGNGFYEFTGLLPGRYSLQFVRPTTFSFTEQDSSNLGTLTSKADPRTGRTAVTMLEPAENDAIWGAGLVAAPGAVSLVSFRATLQQNVDGSEISVGWVTAAELDTFGFHIYLGTDDTFGSARQMTSQIILGEGSDGGVYHFAMPYDPETDPPVESLLVWLVETEIDGSLNYYGPTRVIDPASLNKHNYLPLILR